MDDGHRGARDFISAAHPRSPLRAPDWRWRAAGHFVATASRPIRPWRDRWISAACRVLSNPQILEFRERRERAVAAAVGIHEHGTAPLRAELEACVLAGLTNSEIAPRFGWRVGVVEAYFATFFDVRGRVQARSYILHQVIGPTSIPSPAEPQLALWKLFAYLGGPWALESLLDEGRDADRPRTGPEVADFFARDARATAIQKLAVAARRLPLSAPPQVVLRESLAVLRELERLAPEKPVASAADEPLVRSTDQPFVQELALAGGCATVHCA